MSDEEVQSFYYAHRSAIDEIAHSQKMHTAYALIDFVNQRLDDLAYRKEDKESFASDLGSYYGCLILSALNGRGFGGLSTTKVASSEEASTACLALFIIGGNLAFFEPLPFFPIQASMPAEHIAHYSLINDILKTSSGRYNKRECESKDKHLDNQLFKRIFPTGYKNFRDCFDVYDNYVLGSIKIDSFEKSRSWRQIYLDAISNLKSKYKLNLVTGLESLIKKTNQALSNFGDEHWKLILKSEGKLTSVEELKSLIEKTNQHIRKIYIEKRKQIYKQIFEEISTLKAQLSRLCPTSLEDADKRLREMDTRYLDVRIDDINYSMTSPLKKIFKDEGLINIIQAIHQLVRISPFKAAINAMSTHTTRDTAAADMGHDKVFAGDISEYLNTEQIKIALEMAFKHPLLADLFEVSSGQIEFKGTTQEKILRIVNTLSRFSTNALAKTLVAESTMFLDLIHKLEKAKPVALAASTHPTFIKGLENIQARDQALEKIIIQTVLLKKIKKERDKLSLFHDFRLLNMYDDKCEAIKPGFKELKHQMIATGKEIEYFMRLKNLLRKFTLHHHIKLSYFNPFFQKSLIIKVPA